MFFTPSQSFSDLMESELQESQNENNSLLRTLIPDEGTIKHYLCDEPSAYSCRQFSSLLTSTMEIVQNDCSDMELDQLIHDQSTPELLSTSTPDSSGNNLPDILSNRQLVTNTRRENLKLNFILLVKHGYKLTLTLNTDNSQVTETWHSNVVKQILATQFSSISLKSEYMSKQLTLDRFERLYMDEAITAFQGKTNFHLTLSLSDKSNSKLKANPNALASMCNGIRGFRKLERCDKITLLSNTFYDLFLMKGIVNYDPAIDGWEFPESGLTFDRRDVFLFDRFLNDGLTHIIETFPDRFRNDPKAVLLIYLLIIFNPDLPDLKHSEIVRYEQLTYVYLLGRYLRTVCDSDCEASDNHYRLMAKIDQVKLLRKKLVKQLPLMMIGSLENSISNAI
ncbi:uncharacterized protein LOC107363866 [Tetranychus urticae]|uniref:uncharacterized protein LOC107363866 n=1 Tax=Tetranychus urticae TaxID=32264 RepID=UPI00077BA201|nr:uncharacterized protein LOC107363866 [Tetranychus urticae]